MTVSPFPLLVQFHPQIPGYLARIVVEVLIVLFHTVHFEDFPLYAIMLL